MRDVLDSLWIHAESGKYCVERLQTLAHGEVRVRALKQSHVKAESREFMTRYSFHVQQEREALQLPQLNPFQAKRQNSQLR
jgi:hypothetical protein